MIIGLFRPLNQEKHPFRQWKGGKLRLVNCPDKFNSFIDFVTKII